MVRSFPFWILFLYLNVELTAAPVSLHEEPAKTVTTLSDGVILVDFGRVAFGNIRLDPPAGLVGDITVHFGESIVDGRVNRLPPGSVRYSRVTIELDGGKSVIAAPFPGKRNTEVDSTRHPPAILTPQEWGVIMPFRWVEIEGWHGAMKSSHITRLSAFSSAWDDSAADFHSSEGALNRIWELCKYSIKATTYAGLYVDGDRERIPYEADAYLNQISHYYTDTDTQFARDTFDHLMMHGTWPTECRPHMIFMAHADWMRHGDKAWLESRYEGLKTKLLLDRTGPDGLVAGSSEEMARDLVDWPPGERDGHVFSRQNTVVNAFHLKALSLMAELAEALGYRMDASHFSALYKRTQEIFHQRFFNERVGLYRDGTGTDHSSLHSNLFPLAFGLVPPEHRSRLAGWLVSRGMRCSVYAAQYLLEGLFENGMDQQALALIMADNDRSWKHMVDSGATITWEAWDLKYKSNLDWNHAWGAAPANILPRFVLGAQSDAPGWSIARISPHISGLDYARGKIPTPHGPIHIDWKRINAPQTFQMNLALPAGIQGRLELPVITKEGGVMINGQKVASTRMGDRWFVDTPVSGVAEILVK